MPPAVAGGREMTLLGDEATLWLGLGLATVLLVAITVIPLIAIFYAVFDGGADDAADVQRFVELTEDARRLVPPGLPLFDRERAAAVTAGLFQFQAKKDEARRALWASRDRHRTTAIAEPHDPGDQTLTSEVSEERAGWSQVAS
jgi:hypothetical protein